MTYAFGVFDAKNVFAHTPGYKANDDKYQEPHFFPPSIIDSMLSCYICQVKIFKKPIFVSISPNAQADDVWLAFRLFFMPWKWKRGKCIKKFEEMLKEYLSSNCHSEPFGFAQDKLREESHRHRDSSVATLPQNDNCVSQVVMFESGRTALYAILMALDIKDGDEVLLQAFTCTAAVNPILWVGAKPVYVDLEEGTFNMSPIDLEKKITLQSKVLIIQNTFGFPGRVNELLEIAKKNNLIVLEDCAHNLGATYKGKKIGIFGEASFFSFGRSKVISSVFGGAAATQNPDLAKKIRQIHNKWQYPSNRWIAQQLFHPIYLAIAKPLYNFLSFGKMMIVIGKKLKLISIMVYSVEKTGGKPPFGPTKMPNALACLAIRQLRKIEKFNEHRRELAEFYKQQLSSLFTQRILKQVQDDKNCEPVFLNFPVQVKSFGIRWKCIGEARKNGIYLESWPAKDKKVIGPDNVCLEKLYYTEGMCPVAEKTAQTSINLPTSPNTSIKDAARVIKCIKDFFRE